MQQLERMVTPSPSPGTSGVFNYRGRPDFPRNISAQGSVISWTGPKDGRGADKYRIYLGNESNLVYESDGSKAKPNVTNNGFLNSSAINLPAGVTRMAFVSTVSSLGRESAKIPVIVTGQQVFNGFGVVSDPTTTVAYPTWADVPDLACTKTVATPLVLITFSGTFRCNNTGASIFFLIWRYDSDNPGGIQISPVAMISSPISGQNESVSMAWVDSVSIDVPHTWKIRWTLNSAGPTATGNGTDRAIQVIELGNGGS